MNTLETHVLSMIGENTTTPDVFSDDATGMAQIRDSINDAIEEVCMLTGSHKRVLHIPLISGEYFYLLDLDRDQVAWITDCWLRGNQTRLKRVDAAWFYANVPRWPFNSGTPTHYAHIGPSVAMIWPAPSASADVLECTAVSIPSRYTYDDEQVKIRDTYQWAVVHYAVSEYWASRGDAQTATEHMSKYLGELKLYKLYLDSPSRRWQSTTEKQP